MDYLMTEVATKNNEKRWVRRLFVLTGDSLSCFYESAPHLQKQGKNILTKVEVPIVKQHKLAASKAG